MSKLYKSQFDFKPGEEPGLAPDLGWVEDGPVEAYVDLWETLSCAGDNELARLRGVEVPEDGYPIAWIGELGFRVTRWRQGDVISYEILEGRVTREHTGRIELRGFIAMPGRAVAEMYHLAQEYDDVKY